MKTILNGVLAAALIAAAANATVLWRGDYESGNLSQWDRIDGLTSRLTVVTSPVHQGKYALRTELHQGEISSSGTRNEVEEGSIAYKEGDEYWYAWSTLFPSDYPSNNTWQVFTQWHHSGCCGSPPVEFDVIGEHIQLAHNGDTIVWTAPLVRGVWHDFVLHVKWSNTGSVELWYDGNKVLGPTPLQTIYPGQFTYMKQGLYRNASVADVAVLYHDRTIVGTTMADVAPELLDPAPAPAPSPDAGPPVADAGSPAPLADSGVTDPVPDAGTTDPVADSGVGTTPVDPAVTPTVPQANFGLASGGCSSTGGASLAFIGLLAIVLSRRKRK